MIHISKAMASAETFSFILNKRFLHRLLRSVVPYTHTVLTAIFPDEPGFDGCPLNSPPFIPLSSSTHLDCLLGLYWTGLTLLNGFSFLVNFFFFILGRAVD